MDLKQMKRCSRCREIKPLSEFNKNKSKKSGYHYTCKNCMHIYQKRWAEKNKERIKNKNRLWYEKNKEKAKIFSKAYNEEHKEEIRAYRQSEEYRERAKNRNRKRRLSTNGKTFSGLNKREWTNHCELCGKINKRSHYHHWDDNNLSKGIWICTRCHRMVEAYEHGDFTYLKKYLKLKEFLNKQFQIKEK